MRAVQQLIFSFAVFCLGFGLGSGRAWAAAPPGSVTKVDLVSKGAGSSVELISPILPLALASEEATQIAGKSEYEWRFSVEFTTKQKDIYMLYDKLASRPKDGKIRIKVPVKIGKNTQRVTTVDPSGKILEYDLVILVEEGSAGQAADSGNTGEPNGFLVGGLVGYYRSVSRQGSALPANTQSTTQMVGIRTIYRRRVLRSFTDRLPWSLKLFFDGSGTIGRTFSADAGIGGFPHWLDGRITFEVFAVDNFRIEVGAGISYYGPGLSTPLPGDLDRFFGFVGSARLGYFFSGGLGILLGGNAATPSNLTTPTAILVTQPLEFFFSLSMPIPNAYLELRGRIYSISTGGSVFGGGTYVRQESYLGPEILYSRKF